MVNVAIIGTGFMAQTHADAYKQIDGVNLVAITAVNKEKGQKIAEKYQCAYVDNVNELLGRDEIDVVDICTPTYTHEELVISAAEARKHILCEKPIALTLQSVDRMIAATAQAGVTFMVGQTLRFWPEYMKVKELYDNGTLGDVHVVYANRLAQHPTWGEWFRDVSKSGGGLFDLHLHDIDFMCYLFGNVKSVYAIGKQNELGAWNHVVTNLTFENGTQTAVESSYEMPEGFPFTMSLRASGNKGTVDFQLSAGVNLENLDESVSRFILFSNEEDEITPLKVEEIDPYVSELTYFINCIKNEKKPEVVLPKDNREVLEVMLAIERSLETNEIQYLNSVSANK